MDKDKGDDIGKKVVMKVLKTADKKQYMKEYRKKNIEKWTQLKTCSGCGHTYGASNVGNHMKSKKHKYGVIQKENEKLHQIQSILDQKIAKPT